MNIKLDASVECLDSHAGLVTGVIANPETDEVTHLVVKVDADGVEHLVPVRFILDTTPRGIQLKCTTVQLHMTQLLVETEYVRTPVEEYDSATVYAFIKVLPRYVLRTYAVPHDNIPNGELEIKNGMVVYARDGEFVGRVDEVIMASANEQITHIIMRTGYLWSIKKTRIDIQHVAYIDEGGIHLKSTRPQIFKFPPIKTHRSTSY